MLLALKFLSFYFRFLREGEEGTVLFLFSHFIFSRTYVDILFVVQLKKIKKYLVFRTLLLVHLYVGFLILYYILLSFMDL